MKNRRDAFDVKIVLAYLAIGILWILFSDQIIAFLIQDPRIFSIAKISKDLLFVIATAWVLFMLIKNYGSKHTKTLLRDTEIQYRTLMEQLPVAAYIDRKDGVADFLTNTQIYNITGYTTDEWKKDPDLWMKLIHPDDRQGVLKENERTIKNREAFNLEYRMVTKDGRMIWVHDMASPVVDENNEHLYWQGILVDVTEDKLAEEQVKLSEAQYHMVVEQASDGIIIVSRLGEIFEGNQQICNLLGYTREELQSLSLAKLFPGNDHKISNVYEINPGRTIIAERSLKRKDGTLLLVELSMKALPNNMLIGIVRNISTRKLMEESLTRSEQKFRALIENSLDAIALYSVEGKIIFQSPAATRILGYSISEMLGKSVFEFVSEEDKDKGRAAFEEISKESGQNITFEIRCKSKEGSLKWIEFNATNRLGEAGIDAIVANYRDITVRKNLENAMRETEERYRLLVEKLPAVVFMDTFSDAQLSQYISPRIKDLLGYTPDEWNAAENVWENSLHPDDKERVLAEDIRTDVTNEPFRIEYRMRHRDGHYVWIKEDASIIKSENGIPLSWHGIMVDITEQKRAEAALQKQLKELSILHSVALAEATARDVDKLIESITNIIGDTLYSDNCGVLLLNETKDRLQPHFSYRGTNPENLGLSIPITNGLSGKVATTGRAIRSGDVSLEPEYYKVTTGIRSELCIPIVSGSKIMGVLNVESMLPDAFTDNDERLLNTIAGGMVNAMERIHLFELEKKRREEAEIMRESTLELTALVELDKLFEHIFISLKKLIDFDSVSIELINQGYVEIVAGKNVPQELIGSKYESNIEKWGGMEAIRQPRIISDVKIDKSFIKFEPTSYIRGWMGIPLLAHDEIIGFLNLDSKTPDFFNNEHAAIAQTFANQAATAIEKTRLFELEKKRRESAEIVMQATTSLTNLLDLPSLHKAILEWLNKISPYDSASILEIEGDYVRMTATKGLPNPEKVINQAFPADNTLCKIINSTGQPLIIEDCQKDPRFENWGDSFHVHGWMGVPLISRGQVIGYLTIDSRTPNAFTQDDAIAAQTFAHQAATSIENTRLYTETRQRLEELEMVNRVSFALRAAKDTSEMLPILLNEIIASIGTDAATILLYDDEMDALIPYATSGWLANLPKSSFKPGEGIIGKVYSSGTAHISVDFVNDPLTHPENAEFFRKGWGGITVPIRTANETIGIIIVAIQKPRQIESNHTRLITTLAEIAGNAIYRSNLYERSEEQIRRLTTLREVDSAITSSIDLHITLDILTEHLTSKMGASAARILVFNLNSQMLDCYTAAGFNNQTIRRTSIGIGDGLASQILLNRKDLYIKNIDQEINLKPDPLSAEGFISYYGVPLFSKGATRGIIETYFRYSFIPATDWKDFIKTLAGQAIIAIDNAQLFENLQRSNQELSLAYDTTLEGWGKALELRDKETQGHTRRVTNLTLELARQMGIPKSELTHIRRGALLHDIGKMGVPDNILRKPGPLTKAEMEQMRKHPQYAYDLLSPITYLRPTLDIAYCHHEWWNGKGYPRGLRGEEIPLSARIFAIVDVWDALLSDRPYREAWQDEDVMEYITNLSGKQFDPAVVNSFKKMIQNESKFIQFNSPEILQIAPKKKRAKSKKTIAKNKKLR